MTLRRTMRALGCDRRLFENKLISKFSPGLQKKFPGIHPQSAGIDGLACSASTVETNYKNPRVLPVKMVGR
jgi:hypothetical protein